MKQRIVVGLIVLVSLFYSTTFVPAQNQRGGEPEASLSNVRRMGVESLTGLEVAPGDSLQAAVEAQEGVQIVNFPLGFAPDSSNNILYSRDGEVGFVASRWNNRLFSFDTTTGQMIGNVVVGRRPTGIAMSEQPGKRIILVKNLLSDDVSVVDATDPARMLIQTTFKPPPGIVFSDSLSRPVISSDGTVGFVAADNGRDRLYILRCSWSTMGRRVRLASRVRPLRICLTLYHICTTL